MGSTSRKLNRFNIRFLTILRIILLFPIRIFKINKIVNRISYYDDKYERKSKFKRWMDNFIWLIKKGELNEYYNSWGLDVKDFRNPDDFLSNLEFSRLRDSGNQKNVEQASADFNYIAILRDKYIFSEFLKDTIGKEHVVINEAFLSNNEAYLVENKKWISLTELVDIYDEIVYKATSDTFGNGIFFVLKNGDDFLVNGEKKSKTELLNILSKGNYIAQKVIKQHESIRKFGTKSVNTIRIITIRGKSGNIGTFNAFLRISADKDSLVDNRAKGGFAIGIDLDRGTLFEDGMTHEGFNGISREHPISKITFLDYQLPYWEEIKELVVLAHKQMYTIQSIGWDVAITENGPILLEGNDDFEIGGPQDTYGGLKNKWHQLVNE